MRHLGITWKKTVLEGTEPMTYESRALCLQCRKTGRKRMYIALLVLGVCFFVGLFYCLPVVVKDGIQCVVDVLHNVDKESEV